jgi:translation initiation factor 2B subunit (eIF-2B alpha/beta/delta family)
LSLPPEVEAELTELATDVESGAAELHERCLEAARGLDDGDLREFAARLRTARRDMAPLLSLAHGLETAAAPIAFLSERRKQTAAASEDICRRAVERLGGVGRFITISRSSTVLSVLAALEPAAALCLYSEPGGEGLRSALELCRRGLDARVVADDEAASAVEGVEAGICGADALTDHLFVNKVGTRELARLLARAGKPLYLACDRTKYLDDDLFAELEPNELFEETPLHLVAGVLTDGDVNWW